MKKIAVFALIAISFSSCFQQYYKTNTTSEINGAQIEKFKSENKAFIVHASGEVFQLKNAKLMDGALSGERETLNPKYDKYLNPDVGGANRYPKKERATALSEVHLYTNDSIGGSAQINLPANRIFRVDVYNQDTKATHGSMALSIVGIATPVVGIIILGAVSESQLANETINLNLH